MYEQLSGRLLGVLILACAVGGCAASAGQVRANRSHARVLVRIEHGGHDDQYLDGFNLDGLHYGLVSGDPMLLRLAPGRHEVQLVSRRVGYQLSLVSISEYGDSCATPSCVNLSNTRADRLELTDSPQTECVETLTLDVKAGESHEAVLVASPDGTCHTRG